MKLKLLALTLLTSVSPAHEGVELGPNGGRILEFSDNETLHGEVLAKDGNLHIALLDADFKPVALAAQTLTATNGDRANPEKLTVTQQDNAFIVPMVNDNDFWVVLQFKTSEASDKITARLHYDTANCEGCNSPEWLCKCEPETEKK